MLHVVEHRGPRVGPLALAAGGRGPLCPRLDCEAKLVTTLPPCLSAWSLRADPGASLLAGRAGELMLSSANPAWAL